MTRIIGTLGMVVVALGMAGCQGGLNQNALQAGMLGLKAITLSDAEVQNMARASAAELDQDAQIASPTSAYGKRLNKVFGKHKAESGLNLNYKVYLTKEVNAFAMADGTVRVYSGLMDLMTDDELRFVIGHEIGHVFHGHSKAQMKTQYGLLAARYGLAAAGGTAGQLAAGQLGELGTAVINAQFSQSDELEADAYGFQFLKRNGYQTTAGPSALRKLGSGGGGFLSSHPASDERARKLEAMR